MAVVVAPRIDPANGSRYGSRLSTPTFRDALLLVLLRYTMQGGLLMYGGPPNVQRSSCTRLQARTTVVPFECASMLTEKVGETLLPSFRLVHALSLK